MSANVSLSLLTKPPCLRTSFLPIHHFWFELSVINSTVFIAFLCGTNGQAIAIATTLPKTGQDFR